MNRNKRIGIFDSGYGGLTVLSEIRRVLPEYEYVYLGDNARAPYGNRSFDVVYQFTLQAVKKLFELDCDLVILACNTASAKALRSIQQRDLPNMGMDKRVLGVIRPTTEVVGKFTSSGHIGILGTTGTVKSESYLIELKKEYPELRVSQEACPLWVPLIENNAHDTHPGHLIIEENVTNLLQRDSRIDVLLLACTHYPLVKPIIERFVDPSVQVVPQGEIVALSLKDYLSRHAWLEEKLLRNGQVTYLTTENPETFEEKAELFLGTSISANRVVID
jgi:glutamate racemase